MGCPAITACEAAGELLHDRYRAPGAPVERVNPACFVVSDQGNFSFLPRAYTFSLAANDGARILIDGQSALDARQEGRTACTVRTEPLADGYHTTTVPMHEVTENAH